MKSQITLRRSLVAPVAEIGRTARRQIDEAARTRTQESREPVLRLLNDALATQILSVHRYKRHFGVAAGIKSPTVAKEFFEHSVQEQHHVYRIAERIVELGGEPDFRRSHLEHVERQALLEMIREDLIAERIAMDYYAEVLRHLSNRDSATRRLIEDIVTLKAGRTMELTAMMDELSQKAPEESTSPS